ncbi:hypothetical protein TIFTF001_034359 [Ficus carica]|uniref:Uncharacterized protein n=1 Tax=Ficus carica TaxID=3494 RepID=A0AA88E0D3_FICCA|nr:hypothetical protein TIFTF001_034359 [Ficus carica]
MGASSGEKGRRASARKSMPESMRPHAWNLRWARQAHTGSALVGHARTLARIWWEGIKLSRGCESDGKARSPSRT